LRSYALCRFDGIEFEALQRISQSGVNWEYPVYASFLGVAMKLLKEFREFIARGNVVGLAVAVIMGGAFTAIINSLVGDLITPILGLITGGDDFSYLAISLGDGENAATLTYGNFISAVINFLMISVVVFFLVKIVNKILRKQPEETPATKVCPYCAQTIPEAAVRCPSCTTVLEPKEVPKELR
jgi:large conductance mechanosensitive channel